MAWKNDAQRRAVMAAIMKKTQDHNAHVHNTGRPPWRPDPPKPGGTSPHPYKPYNPSKKEMPWKTKPRPGGPNIW